VVGLLLLVLKTEQADPDASHHLADIGHIRRRSAAAALPPLSADADVDGFFP